MPNKWKELIWLTVAIFCVVGFRVMIDFAARFHAGWLTWTMVVILGVIAVISIIMFGIYHKRKD